MKILNKLYAIFFEKENAEPLGLFRILVGICIFVTFLLDAPFIADYYSNEGYMPLSQIPFAFSILQYASSVEIIYAAYVLLLIAAFFLTIGYKTRMASIVTFLLLLLFHERNSLILTSGDTLLRVLSFYLMIANSGAAYSVDSIKRKLKGKETKLVPKWNRLLIKYQVSIFYFFAGFSKTPGTNWRNGTAVYYALNNPNFARFLMPWLQKVPILVNIMSWGALITELSVPFLLWFARARIIAIAIVIILQLIIFATMSIGTFQIISIISVLIFLEKTEIDAFWNWLGRRKKYQLLYDGSCEFCKKCLVVIQSMDVMKKFEHADFRQQKIPSSQRKNLERQIWLVTPKKTYKGFFAFRKMAMLMPALWIIVPLLYLPFAGTIGTKIYNYISCKRFQFCKT